MSDFSNNLSLAEAERLAVLAEECGEVVQVIGKILRHGYENGNPHIKPFTSNRTMLELELGDVWAALQMLTRADDVSRFQVEMHSREKTIKIAPYLHHQEDQP